MAPTILIVGATGNTGRAVVQTLSSLSQTNTFLSGYRFLALTRSRSSPAAQSLSSLPNVTVLEKAWIDITPEWLQSQSVVRAFIASHNEPTQFAEESTFLLAALNAGVEYVVRISTTAANVKPDCKAYYPRTHWAIETLLGSKEFEGLKWSSLQPNIFSNYYLMGAAQFIGNFKKEGKQTGELRVIGNEDAGVGIIDPDEVGIFAAYLLAQENVDKFNGKKFVLNGPEDITGKQVVELVEEYIGVKVQKVVFKDMSFVDQMAEYAQGPKSVVLSIKFAAETGWNGECGINTSSKEFLELAPPKRTPRDVLKTMLGGEA